MPEVQTVTARRVEPPCSGAVGAGIDLDAITAWLRNEVKWPKDCELRSLRINRLWAGRAERITFELALSLAYAGTSREFMIQGGLGEPARPTGAADCGRPVGKTHRRPILSQHGLLGLRLENRSAGLWLCSPDRDRRLRLAAQLLSDDGLASLTGKLGLCPSGDTQSSLDALLVAYRVNRRCVVRVRSRHAPDAPGLFFKAFRRSPAAEAIAFVERLVRRLDEDSSGVLRLPALVKHVPDQRLIVTAEIPQDACPLGTSSRDTTLAGGALATLHGHAATDGHRCLPKHTPSAELATVARWISVLSRVSQPGDATRLARITDSLTVKTDAVSGARSSLLHRDFHHAQLMRRDETLWLVDLDTLCVGHAELDLSTFLAHAYLETLRDGHNPASFGETTTPFLEGYLSHGGRFDRVRLGYYLPCALARLAALQLTRGLSREAVEQMWTLAERILEHPLALNDILGT